ncbi:MAG TPA: hypothetical protein VMU01_12505 [Rhizomicrobium sp.]|nr:hypothetical protein [Rhizomicrobium sp.]
MTSIRCSIIAAALLWGLTGSGPAIAGPHAVVPSNWIGIKNLPVVVAWPGTLPFFPPPEHITPPYGLQIVYSTTTPATSAFHAGQPTTVHLPAVTFDFPITPYIDGYLSSGLHYAYKAVGWAGHIYTEVCLTANEAQSWPARTQEAADTATCPDEADTVKNTFTPRTWYQIGDTRTDMYVIQNQTFQYIPTPVPVAFYQVSFPMRFHLNGYTYYYTNNHTGPNDYNAACPANVCGGEEDVHTPAFNLVVLPTAMVQLKVIPENIVYMPPGNKSTANLKITRTFSTTITAGETAEVDNSSSNDQWMELVSEGGISAGIGSVFKLGFNGSSDTKWDNTTVLKSGQSLERDLTGANEQAIAFTRTITADPASVPGAAGAFAKEPFWSDLVVVLVHPQLGIWDFFGNQKVQLIAAQSAAGLPNDIAVTVGELDACANHKAPFANGYSFTTASQQQETLTADDCKALAKLDPFWGIGQSADVTSRAQLMVPSQEYGIPLTGPASDNSLDIQVITSNSETVTDTNTTTYTSTVDDIVSTTSSSGITLGGGPGGGIPVVDIGLSNSVTLKSGSVTDTQLTMQLTYKNSSATTNRLDVQTEGLIDDGIKRAAAPHVEVYSDDAFGSLMFRDPDAPCSPMPACRATLAPLGPTSEAPHLKKKIIRPIITRLPTRRQP